MELYGFNETATTEIYTVGWADVTDYFLTNNISGAWCGSFFANMDRWNELPEHLKTMLQLAFDSSHYYRQHWYWGRAADLLGNGKPQDMSLTSARVWGNDLVQGRCSG